MFEASVNRQFKSRFSGLGGVVHIGPISVLRRIFNGHSIDGYVLSNNFEDRLVVMKKKEFEALCKYIKVDIERTSSIPRAKLIKEKGLRGIDLNPGSAFNPTAVLPYRDVTSTGYSNYLNGAYLSKIQPYTHMVLRGMNFSHYEVISKAMSSNMAGAISQAYEKYGSSINKILSNRSYNAEEYEVALLSVAYIGIEELQLEYLKAICADDGSGAKAMKNKLDKYRGKDAYQSANNKSTETSYNPNWYIDTLNKYSNRFLSIREKGVNEQGFMQVELDVSLKNEVVTLAISAGSVMLDESGKLTMTVWPYQYFEYISKEFCFTYNEKEPLNVLEKKLISKIEHIKELVLKKLNVGYDFTKKDWYYRFLKRYASKFEKYNGDNPNNLPQSTYNFVYKARGKKYPLNIASIDSVFGSNEPGFRVIPTEWSLIVKGYKYSTLKGLSLDETDQRIFEMFEELLDYIDSKEAKLAEENDISEEEKEVREKLYETWYIDYLEKKGLDFEVKDSPVGANIDILLGEYIISMIRGKTYHNKYSFKITSNIPDTKEDVLICRYSASINELESNLDKVLNRFLSKVNIDINRQAKESQGMNKAELERRLEYLQNLESENEGEYSKLRESKSEIRGIVNMLSSRLPLSDNSCWYTDDFSDRPEEIAIQYINYDTYYPTVVFSYTNEYTLSYDKFIHLLCVDIMRVGNYDELYLRVYPYVDGYGPDKDDIFVYPLDYLYSRTDTLWDAIKTCMSESSVRGMTETEAMDLYDWYKVINAPRIIEDLSEDMQSLLKIEKEFIDTLKEIRQEIAAIKKKLGYETSKGDLFSNRDSSDFSDLMDSSSQESISSIQKRFENVDPFAEQNVGEMLSELSQLFQF